MSESQIWTLNVDEKSIAWLHFDTPDSSVNTLSQQAIAELSIVVDDIANRDLKGLIILSDKAFGFIVGADISEFTKVVTVEQAQDFMSAAHVVFKKIERLNIPTVAMVHGTCLGGGLELALSCDYVVAEENASLGFPEVMLGIFPGFGGSVRSIERIGVLAAMTMMLTGRASPAKRAQKTGLVDVAVPERQLYRAAVHTIEQKPQLKRQSTGLLQKLMCLPFVRPIIANVLRTKTKKLVNPKHYPAPFALIDLWKKHGGNRESMLEQEVKAVAQLIIMPQAQNLVRLFFLQERMKALGKGEKHEFHHVHVIGAGAMGGDIAAWCVLQGLTVTLQDQAIEVVAAAVKRAAVLYTKKLRTPRAIQEAMDRLIPDMTGIGISQADIVIEAIVENLAIKQGLYQAVEPQMKEGAVLATNTSGIPIGELATKLKKPERLVGIHFFNPVAKMKLVEIVAGELTDETTLHIANAFVTRIRRLPLPVKSSPGFLVNRILMPYLMEAILMVDEGKKPEAIDQAALDFGMPMGPITLADRVGLDICVAVANDLAKISADTVPGYLDQWVKDGRLGLKSGQGFFTYKQGKAQKSKEFSDSRYDADIPHRLIMRMANEAVSCLREGIVEDADLLDAGLVFGTGFAPFRGGVMQYIQTEGKEIVLERLNRLEQKYGVRFKQDSGWKQIQSKH